MCNLTEFIKGHTDYTRRVRSRSHPNKAAYPSIRCFFISKCIPQNKQQSCICALSTQNDFCYCGNQIL